MLPGLNSIVPPPGRPLIACPERRGDRELHLQASFQTPQPDHSDSDKVQKPSDMVCSMFLNTISSLDISRFGISAWS